MPEGGNAAEPPARADQQVDMQIAVDRVQGMLGGLFGRGWQHESGGGGAGGSYEFTSLEELDGVIAQFVSELDAIRRDGYAIGQAMQLVEAPAEDMMSVEQAKATKRSLEAMLQHNRSMEQYAVAEIEKLQQARQGYAAVEQDNADGMGRAEKT